MTIDYEAKTAAADPNCTAVALAEQSAAKVSFQRFAPNFPPDKNANSATIAELAAVQFSGNNAKSAIILHFLHLETQK